MTTYVGFLRAINLGPTRKFPKAEIVAATEAAGFADVATYINTGNVRFTTRMRSRARIEAALEASYAERAGFEVPTVVFTATELAEIAAYGASLGHDGRHYVSLLKDEPSAGGVAALAAAAGPGERLEVTGRAAHLLVGPDYHTATLTNAPVERHLGVATNRNLTVITAIAGRWCA